MTIQDVVYAWGRYYSETPTDLFWSTPTLIPSLGTGGAPTPLGAVQSVNGEAAFWNVIVAGVPYGFGDNQYCGLSQITADTFYIKPLVSASTVNTGTGSFDWATLTSGATILQVDGGDRCNWGLDSNGSVWAWGNSSNGVLGNNNIAFNGNGTVTQETQAVPTQVLGVGGTGHLTLKASYGAITGGQTHLVGLLASGQVVACGTDQHGECGDGVTLPTSLINNAAPATSPTTGGSSNTNFPFNAVPVKVLTGAQGDVSGFLSNIVQISAGNHHTLARTADGHVLAWGFGGFGQLGQGAFADASMPVQVLTGDQGDSSGFLSNIVDISGGGGIIATDGNSYCTDASGNVYGFGANTYGQLGLGVPGTPNFTNQNVPKLIPLAANGITGPIAAGNAKSGTRHGLILDNKGILFVTGSNQFGAVGAHGIATGQATAGNVSGNTSTWLPLNKPGANPVLPTNGTINMIWAGNNTSIIDISVDVVPVQQASTRSRAMMMAIS